MSGAWWIFGLGSAGALGWMAMSMEQQVPFTYAMSEADAKAKLDNATSSFSPSRGLTTTIVSRQTFNGVSVTKSSSLGDKYTSSCSIDFQSQPDGKITAIPSCGGDPESSSAQARVMEKISAAVALEHVDAVLRERAFDGERVKRMQRQAAMQDLPDMQKEALEAHDRMQSGNFDDSY
ncbi:hypothetical protein [Qipengyuania sphaerica]|uniref:hypothetical protein n=1 Tax=Qipengyuania sphaerica TaxID=2867243 RepID=UPI001C8803C1|nr:hypothetical protein [Qipengyuania sphaerica]MBX7540690.1 hypothetical protein [Qipengyuania sphaerica]